MEQFRGKVAIVTGASSGIGAATAKALADAGMKVVGLARRKEKIEELAKDLNGGRGNLHALKVDVTIEEDILQAFKWVTDNVGPVHVLINNAGVITPTSLVDGETEKWKTALDVNVLGVTIASREAIKIMRANNIDGHIININSVAGHKVVNEPFNIYSASKYAVTALTETFRLELIRLKSKIKLTNLSPGVVHGTDLFEGLNRSMDNIKDSFKIENPLLTEDIVNAIKYVLSTPPHVQVTELIMRPIDQIF